MAISYTRIPITSGFNLSNINVNFERINTALADAISRETSSNNQMNVNLDMNSNRIINVPTPTQDQDAVNKEYVDGTIPALVTTATTAANTATNAANLATSSASSATMSATQASGSATSAASSLASFRGVYYGDLASDPTLDPNGNPPDAGDFYYNTTPATQGPRQFDGTSWQPLVINQDDVLLKANNLSDLTNAATARTNLGLGSLSTLSQVPNDSIDLDQMASGTRGQAITYDENGNPVRVDAGTLGQVLGYASDGDLEAVNPARNLQVTSTEDTDLSITHTDGTTPSSITLAGGSSTTFPFVVNWGGEDRIKATQDGRIAIGRPDEQLPGNQFPNTGIDLDIHRDYEQDDTTFRAPVLRLDHAFGSAPSYLTDAWPVVGNAVLGQNIGYFDGNLVGAFGFRSDADAIPASTDHTNKFDARRGTQGNFDHGYYFVATKAHRNASERIAIRQTSGADVVLCEDGSRLGVGQVPANWGGASGPVIFLRENGAGKPTSNPSNGGLLFVDNGALKYRGPNGTETTIAPA